MAISNILTKLPSANFTIESRQGAGTRYSDVQRNYAWDLIIPFDLINRIKFVHNNRGKSNRPLTNLTPKVSLPNPISLVGGWLLLEEDFIIKCRSAIIPNKKINTIETRFMGNKKVFPGNVEFSNTFVVEYEENERQTMKNFFDDWMFAIYNSDFNSGGDNRKIEDGVGNAGNATLLKEDYQTNLDLSFYAYSGISLDKKITFYNSWPIEISEVPVTYHGNSDSIKYNITFAYDVWELTPNALINLTNFQGIV